MERALPISRRDLLARRVGVVIAGAALVALAAQISVPLPGTPVPMTLQPLAVLLVGGWLGPELGAASLVTYVLLGAVGLPVFTPSAILAPGLGRLAGPTGGYLLAYPVAAYVVGRVAGEGRRWSRLAAAVLAGVALIHLGGLAQLAILTGSVAVGAHLGTLPFLLGDVGKVAIAVLLLKSTIGFTRARL